jgi:hypothetical protein
MLTDLSFIAPGKPWPPEDADEKARLADHKVNRLLYSGDHEAVFPKFSAYLKDRIEDDKKIAILIGLAKTATKEYLNFVIGEAPDIDAPIVYEVPDYEVLTDASRTGIGLFEVTQDGIIAQNPENCYLVVSPGNVRKVWAYVFFQEFDIEVEKKKIPYVKFTIHEAGSIQHVVYERKDGKLGDPRALQDFPQFSGLQVDASGKQSTGVNELLVVRVDNILTTDRYYGQSDYSKEAKSKLEALDLAYSRRAEVLAKFSRPKPMAGASAFTFDHAKQKWVWKTDEAIIVEKDEPTAQYLTWQAQLEDVQREIDGLYKQLLKDFALTDDDELNKAESGTAIRLKQSETLAKVRWLATEYKKALAVVLSLKSKLDAALGVGQVAFEPDVVQVHLQDGIPDDPRETIQTCALAVAGGFMSVEKAVSVCQGLALDSPELADEVARIRANPSIL